MNTIRFQDNPCAVERPDQYVDIIVDVVAVLKSWRMSLLSLEWMDKEGDLLCLRDLKPSYQVKRLEVEAAIQNGHDVIKPVLGLGIYDNVEIGSKTAEFTAVALSGASEIPVHVLVSQLDDFQSFRSDVD